ncbi:unnamed protein product [Brassica rapa subsp. narinosa]
MIKLGVVLHKTMKKKKKDQKISGLILDVVSDTIIIARKFVLDPLKTILESAFELFLRGKEVIRSDSLLPLYLRICVDARTIEAIGVQQIGWVMKHGFKNNGVRV